MKPESFSGVFTAVPTVHLEHWTESSNANQSKRKMAVDCATQPLSSETSLKRSATLYNLFFCGISKKSIKRLHFIQPDHSLSIFVGKTLTAFDQQDNGDTSCSCSGGRFKKRHLLCIFDVSSRHTRAGDQQPMAKRTQKKSGSHLHRSVGKRAGSFRLTSCKWRLAFDPVDYAGGAAVGSRWPGTMAFSF